MNNLNRRIAQSIRTRPDFVRCKAAKGEPGEYLIVNLTFTRGSEAPPFILHAIELADGPRLRVLAPHVAEFCSASDAEGFCDLANRTCRIGRFFFSASDSRAVNYVAEQFFARGCNPLGIVERMIDYTLGWMATCRKAAEELSARAQMETSLRAALPRCLHPEFN